MCFLCFLWLLPNHFDLEKFRPELARHEETVACAVVGDAVENGVAFGVLGLGKQSAQIDPAENTAVSRRDPGDAVGLPDICKDFVANKFQLVELGNRQRAVLDCDSTD